MSGKTKTKTSSKKTVEYTRPVPERPRIFLGVPTYNGEISIGTVSAVLQALAVNEKSSTQVFGPVFSISSALCFNYNKLWAEFLNAKRAGRVDVFCMMHSDLAVVGHPYWDQGRSWTDWMWDTMVEKGLSCLSVTNAIKNREGHTSVAMGNGDWGQRRLSFKEMEGLPPTVTSDEFLRETGKVLLVNTGILMIDPEPDWEDDFCFEFFDRLWRNPENGKVDSQMAPEDWNMSRFFHKYNAPYATTSEVKTMHKGIIEYPNWDDGSGLYIRPEQAE